MNLAPIAGDAVDAILCATVNTQAIVISKSARGTRPRWQFDAPTRRQMFALTATKPRALVYGLDAAGDLVMLRRNEGRALKRDGEYNPFRSPRSPLQWCNPSPPSIADARAECRLVSRARVARRRVERQACRS